MSTKEIVYDMGNPASERGVELENDDVYLRIWEAEQRHTTVRWTVATFFLSISFAIFGLSLQLDKSPVPRAIPQLLAVVIYWFTYLLFLRFNDFTNFLRWYLKEMEASGKTSLSLQTKSKVFMGEHRRPSATLLLLYFGLAYTVAGIVLGLVYR